MFGYSFIPFENLKVKVGELEKVVLDYLYFHPEIRDVDDLDALRFNKEVLSSNLDQDKLYSYSKLFESKALNKRLKVLDSYLEEYATHR